MENNDYKYDPNTYNKMYVVPSNFIYHQGAYYNPNFFIPPQQFPQQFQQQFPQQFQPQPMPEYLNDAIKTKGIDYVPWDKKDHVPDFLDPKDSIKLNIVKKTHKKDKRCYTCKPRGKVKKHIINTNESGNFYFHHDMHKRPVIIITPVKHVQSINELSSEELVDLFSSINKFVKFWDIEEYQVSFNAGRWQTHEHFHCKIRISEKIINRMRRDHFCKIKMDDRYESN